MGQAPAEPVRPRRRLILWIALGVLVALVAAGAWVASRALIVRGELADAAGLQHRAQTALADGDLDEVGRIVDELDTHADAAATASGDPLWRAAEVIPYIGPNLSAVRVVAEQFDAVTDDVAQPLVALAQDLGDGGLLVDGAFDVATIVAAQRPLQDATAALTEADATLAEVPRDQLIAQVDEGIADLETLIGTLSGTVAGLADLTRVLPGALGADEPRSILVMFQNNAELRTGGGITGSFAELVADHGALELVRQADSSEFRRSAEQLLPIPESTTALYGDIVGRYVQNTTATPDFDLSARLASEWWSGLTGRSPDLVVAIDPIVLRSLLAVTGPISLADGSELEHDGFVRKVMVAPYLHRSTAEQTLFFQDLTERFFDALLTSSAGPGDWIEALRTPVERGRISVWSAHPDEASLISGSALAGSLARHEAAGPRAFAVYLNDGTGSKMDSSLAVALAVVTGSCRADDRQEVVVRVHLGNEAPDDAGTAWPRSMTGGGMWGVTPGHIATTVAVAAPAGWFFGGTMVDGVRRGAVDVEDGGFPTSATEVTLAPGESSVVEVRFVAPTTDEIEPLLLNTPLLVAPDEGDTTPLVCG